MKKSIKTLSLLFLMIMVITQISPVCYAANGITGTQDSSNSSNGALYIIIIGLLVAILAVISIIVWHILKNQKTIRNLEEDIHRYQEQYETDIKSYKEESKNLAQQVVDESTKCVKLRLENRQLQKKYDDLDKTYQILKYRHEKIVQIYPSSEQEANFIIENERRQKDMLIAKQTDTVIQEALKLPAGTENFDKISTARKCYLQLTPAQKSYIGSDVNKLEQLYGIVLSIRAEQEKKAADEKSKLDAINAINNISRYMSQLDSGRTENLDKLEQIQELYYSGEDVTEKPSKKRFF